jgi:flagellar biosynthesis protein FliQ
MNNIWITWGDVFNSSLQDLWWGLIQFTPRLVIAILLFIVGWIVGNLIAKAFEQVFLTMKIDKLLASVGTDDLFRRAGMSLNSGYFIGQVMKWFVLIIFLLPSLNLVGLNSIGVFLQEDVLSFLPRVIIAVFVLIIATFVSDAISKFIMAGAKSMNLHSTKMLGAIAKYAVWTFAFIIALGQLGVAPAYMQILFSGVIAMFALAGALAFGLGGKDAAARFISKIKEEISNRH